MKNKITFLIFLISAVAVFASACDSHKTLNANEISVSAADTDAAEPAIAADAAGNIYVLYVEHGANKTADVYLQKFDVDEQPTGGKVRINPEIGRATAWRGDSPTIKIGADETVYVGWTARVETSTGSANDLNLSVSNDGGKTFHAPIKVNDDQLPGVHGMHSLEADKNGRVYFAWLDERFLKTADQQPEQMPMDMSKSENGEMKHQKGEPNREVYFAASTDGGKSFSANVKIAGNVCPCCKTSLKSAPDGRLYVSWRQVLDGDFRHIAVSSSIDGGNNFAPFTIVSDDRWQISACPVSGAAMTVDKNNNLKIVWFTAGAAGTPGIYQSESKDGGASFSPRVLVSDQTVSGTPVIMQNSDDNSRIVFSAADKNTYFLAAKNASEFAGQNHISDAELASAAISKGKILIAFVRKVGEKRNIFLTNEQ